MNEKHICGNCGIESDKPIPPHDCASELRKRCYKVYDLLMALPEQDRENIDHDLAVRHDEAFNEIGNILQPIQNLSAFE